MHLNALLLPALLAVVTVACLALVLRLVACNRGRAETAEQLKTETTTEKLAVRQLRLGSHNLRAIGMTLQGHAEHLGAGGTPDVAAIADAANSVFDIADYMHEWSQHVQSTQALNEEAIQLGNALDEAVSTIALTMQPGRRNWLIEPDVLAVRLRADRRALRHVLTRALSVLVRSSGHDASIRLRLDGTADEVAVAIEQQPGAGAGGNPALNGAGPDLRLTLARALMEAHGGTFDVAHCDDRGVRVRIAFPAARLIKRLTDMTELPPVESAPHAVDDRFRRALVT
jgi:K+-sensing histidine kinase KdpD